MTYFYYILVTFYNYKIYFSYCLWFSHKQNLQQDHILLLTQQNCIRQWTNIYSMGWWNVERLCHQLHTYIDLVPHGYFHDMGSWLKSEDVLNCSFLFHLLRVQPHFSFKHLPIKFFFKTRHFIKACDKITWFIKLFK